MVRALAIVAGDSGLYETSTQYIKKTHCSPGTIG